MFFVSEDNPVDGLTSEQIRNIYSGNITNWKKLGGRNLPILAFQRPKNSGSQTTMEKFMGDAKLKEPLKVEFEYSMVGGGGLSEQGNRYRLFFQILRHSNGFRGR